MKAVYKVKLHEVLELDRFMKNDYNPKFDMAYAKKSESKFPLTNYKQ